MNMRMHQVGNWEMGNAENGKAGLCGMCEKSIEPDPGVAVHVLQIQIRVRKAARGKGGVQIRCRKCDPAPKAEPELCHLTVSELRSSYIYIFFFFE